MLTPAPGPATPRVPRALPVIPPVCTVRLFPVPEGGFVLASELLLVTVLFLVTMLVPSHAAVVLVPVMLCVLVPIAESDTPHVLPPMMVRMPVRPAPGRLHAVVAVRVSGSVSVGRRIVFVVAELVPVAVPVPFPM